MAAAVVTVIVEDILQSLQEGIKLGQRWGVEHEIIEIQGSLSSIRGVLPEAENKYGHSLKLQDWVEKLKDVAFYVEALLEELSVEEVLWQRKRMVHRLFRAMDRLKFRRRIREMFSTQNCLLSGTMSNGISLVSNIPAEIGKAEEEARTVPFIGRDSAKIELMGHLLDRGWERKRDLSVITVYGRGGIGKTALVRNVLSESELSRHFDVIIWVNASPPFDENRMARDLIASVMNGVAPEENVVEEQLLVRVGKILDVRKKYLFILDDLSFLGSEWPRCLRFLSFLGGGATGSKILVTTRDRKRISYEKSPTFHLQMLTLGDSLDFLLKIVSGGGGKKIIDPANIQIAEEVAAKCYGNPLFVRAVGDYLSLQHDTSDWSSLRDILRARLDYDALSTLFDKGYPYGHLSPMVKRYNHLPPRIKRCFGFCSLFPRGHVIDRQTLAELWIAIGYIKSSNEDHRPLEDIADDYFRRLLKEELFQVKKFDTFGNERSVVLHPNAEELARSVAGWECRALGRNVEEEVGKARHISVIDYRKFSLDRFSCTVLQTVLHFVDDTSKCQAIWNNNISYLTNARVLDLHTVNVETVLKNVWKLKLLKYLDLSDNKRIETLPPAITGLPNLQTLKLSGCCALKELPPDMRKMALLRHLYINGCRKLCHMPKGLGDLKFLNILTDFIFPPDDSSSVDSANLSDLCKLNDLRGSLRITNFGYSEATKETFKIQGLLDKKSSLESLELIFRDLPADKMALFEKLRLHPNLKGLKIHNCRATRFPGWLAQPLTYLPNLVEVALIGCENCNSLPQFGQLHHLKLLTIQGLPDLLHMESGPEVSSLDVANNAQPFAKLSSLSIMDCPKLECLPLIPHLAKLTLVNVNEQLFEHPFWVASSLKTLRLENIELLHHSSELWLQDPTSLEELHIRNCPKLNFPSMMMPRLTKLTLANVGEELFKQPCHLPCLKTLRLENIELLDHLPEHLLRDLTCLEELHIGSCPSLVSLSRGMMHLENLQSLSIWNCKNLDLSKDEHGNIMMELQGLNSLKFLTIYKASKIEHLPEWLSHVYTLKFLCIRSCPNLVALPEWIGNLWSLKLIELVHCPGVKALPAGMSELNDDSPRKLSIVGCPHLQSEGIEHSRRL